MSPHCRASPGVTASASPAAVTGHSLPWTLDPLYSHPHTEPQTVTLPPSCPQCYASPHTPRGIGQPSEIKPFRPCSAVVLW